MRKVINLANTDNSDQNTGPADVFSGTESPDYG